MKSLVKTSTWNLRGKLNCSTGNKITLFLGGGTEDISWVNEVMDNEIFKSINILWQGLSLGL